MTRAADWNDWPAGLNPVAPQTGPFPHMPFLATAWRHLHRDDEDLAIGLADDGAVALTVSESGVRFVAPEHVTDYHSPLGSNGSRVLASLLDSHPGTSFRLDSMPDEAVGPVSDSLTAIGATHTVTEHEVAAVLTLPTSYDEWLMGIGKKERHEVRRKRRRFEATYGATELEAHGHGVLPAFAELHRCQPGDKGSFMTEQMEAFFADLMTVPGATIHTLSSTDGILAAAFGFETDTGYYYYNSAFEPEAASASPGVVLLACLIEAQIERGASVFDFLKGTETYKFRHGAEPRPLYVVEGTTP